MSQSVHDEHREKLVTLVDYFDAQRVAELVLGVDDHAGERAYRQEEEQREQVDPERTDKKKKACSNEIRTKKGQDRNMYGATPMVETVNSSQLKFDSILREP